MNKIIRHTIINTLGKSKREIVVDVPEDMTPMITDSEIIRFLIHQQPYLVKGETYKIEKKEIINNDSIDILINT